MKVRICISLVVFCLVVATHASALGQEKLEGENISIEIVASTGRNVACTRSDLRMKPGFASGYVGVPAIIANCAPKESASLSGSFKIRLKITTDRQVYVGLRLDKKNVLSGKEMQLEDIRSFSAWQHSEKMLSFVRQSGSLFELVGFGENQDMPLEYFTIKDQAKEEHHLCIVVFVPTSSTFHKNGGLKDFQASEQFVIKLVP